MSAKRNWQPENKDLSGQDCDSAAVEYRFVKIPSANYCRMSSLLRLDRLGIVIRVRHARPVPFDLALFPRWLRAFTDPEKAFDVEPKAVTTRIQDLAFGYEMGIDLFGFGKVELKPEAALMECNGARTASDLEILNQVLGQFRGALGKAELTTPSSKVEFVVNAHCKPESTTKIDVIGQFAAVSIPELRGVALSFSTDGKYFLDAKIEHSLVDDEMVFIQIRLEGVMSVVDSFLNPVFPLGFFEPLKAFNLEVTAPP